MDEETEKLIQTAQDAAILKMAHQIPLDTIDILGINTKEATNADIDVLTEYLNRIAYTVQIHSLSLTLSFFPKEEEENILNAYRAIWNESAKDAIEICLKTKEQNVK